MSGFAENLKKCRTNKGISQDELAKKIGIHPVQFSRYERGQSVPSIEVVQKIASVLEISIDILVLGDENTKAKTSLKDRELLSMFSKVQELNNDDQDCVKKLLKAFLFQKDVQQKLA